MKKCDEVLTKKPRLLPAKWHGGKSGTDEIMRKLLKLEKDNDDNPDS